MTPRSPSFRPWDEEVTQNADLLLPFAHHSSTFMWSGVKDAVERHILARGMSVEALDDDKASDLYSEMYESLSERFGKSPLFSDITGDGVSRNLGLAYLGLCSDWNIDQPVTMAEVVYAANTIYCYTSRKDFEHLLLGGLAVAEVAYMLSEVRREFFLSVLNGTTVGLHYVTYEGFAPHLTPPPLHESAWWAGRRVEFTDGVPHLTDAEIYESVLSIKHAPLREPRLSSGRSEDALVWLWLGSYSFAPIITGIARQYDEKVVNTIDSVRRSILWIPAGREIAQLSLRLREVGWWNAAPYLMAGVTDARLIADACGYGVTVDTLLSVV